MLVESKKDCIFAVRNNLVGIMNRKLKAKSVISRLYRGIEQ